MVGRSSLRPLAAIGLLTVALWPAASHGAVPASRVAAAMASGSSLVEPVNGVRRYSARPSQRAWHQAGPYCRYLCHRHGVIKHCRSSCR